MTTEELEQIDGTPSRVQTEYIDIKWQLGPVKEYGVNGTTMEQVALWLLSWMDGVYRGVRETYMVQDEFATIQMMPYGSTDGATVGEVLSTILTRLRAFNTGAFQCRENSLAITAFERAQILLNPPTSYGTPGWVLAIDAINEAVAWLYKRTRDRQQRGVEGTYQQ
jgi:hypothetical protein